MMLDYEPYYIRNDNGQNGVHNFIANYFSKNLKDYNHKFINVNASRLFRLLTTKSNTIYCSPGLGGRPFKKEVIYSDSMFEAPAAGLAVLKDGSFSSKEEVKLKEVFEQNKYKIGWPENGTFGPNIQKVFNKNKDRIEIINNIQISVGTSMVLKKRIDGFMNYPLAFYYSQVKSNKTSKLKFIKLKDEPFFTSTHSLCANSKEGQIAINKINGLLKSSEYKRKTVKILTKHMPKNIIEGFLKKNKVE